MDILESAALLFSLTALFSFLNHKFIRLPGTIGVMIISLALSLVLVMADSTGILKETTTEALKKIDFTETLMRVMLSFLLFAGALHVDLERLAKQKLVIGLLATLGTAVSTILVGFFSYWVLQASGQNVPLLYCLVFGALISPTDPIAVLGILKKAGVSESLETKITGESLFNDGVGVVIFTVLAGLATGKMEASSGNILGLFLQEAAGGIVFGFVLGYAAHFILKQINHYQTEIMITLSVVMGGYTLASRLHTSGPLAMVVAGLVLGNHGRYFAMSEETRHHLDNFWELLDHILNAFLFVFIGLEILVLPSPGSYLLAGLAMIPITLVSRFISVGLPVNILKFRRQFSPRVIRILTWGGLRGGISIALALSLPPSKERDMFLTITYIIVCFSIIVQGLTLGKYAGK